MIEKINSCHKKIRSMMLPLKNKIKSSAGIDVVALSYALKKISVAFCTKRRRTAHKQAQSEESSSVDTDARA